MRRLDGRFEKRFYYVQVKFWKELLFLVLFGGLTSGCAFTDITIQMPQPGVSTKSSGGNGRALLVPTFVDKRPEQRIGMKKNNYGMDTASVFPSQDPNSWLGSRLRDELSAAGFLVNSEGDTINPIKIEGFTYQLFIEPVVQWMTVDLETDLWVNIRVSRPDGLEAERQYFVKGIEQNPLFASEDSYVESLRKASNELMKRVVDGLINLLNRFPETQGRS